MTKNLSTLSILHYVYGALVALGSLAAAFFIGLGILLSSDFVANHAEDPPPEFIGTFFQTFGAVLFVVLLVWGTLIILSGRWIAKRRNRTGSIVIAALCLLSFPLGTALGVFGLVVLLNDEVRKEYEATGVPSY